MIPTYHVTLELWELAGLLGALTYSASYVLVAYDRLPSQSPAYYWSKLVAALLVLISLTQHFNLAAAIIQVFFVAVSVIGIVRHAKRVTRIRRQDHAMGSSSLSSLSRK